MPSQCCQVDLIGHSFNRFEVFLSRFPAPFPRQRESSTYHFRLSAPSGMFRRFLSRFNVSGIELVTWKAVGREDFGANRRARMLSRILTNRLMVMRLSLYNSFGPHSENSGSHPTWEVGLSESGFYIHFDCSPHECVLNSSQPNEKSASSLDLPDNSIIGLCNYFVASSVHPPNQGSALSIFI